MAIKNFIRIADVKRRTNAADQAIFNDHSETRMERLAIEDEGIGDCRLAHFFEQVAWWGIGVPSR